jgi:acetyltransferase-like isoleucine patch superfamily enzyme
VILLKLARRLRDMPWRWLASQLRPHLAVTPLVWGDKRRLVLGRDVIANDTLFNVRSGRIVIEDDVFFGHRCLLLTGTHDYTLRGLARQDTVPAEGRDIVIHRGAWIASDVIVLGPCTIGAHAVIAAGSVVTGAVEAECIYGGALARKLRRIAFHEDLMRVADA